MNKWLNLAPFQRLAVIEAAFILIAVRVGLRLTSFGGMNRLTSFLNRLVQSRTGDGKQDLDMVVWAIDRVGLVLLGQNSCLTIALAGQFMLGRRGIPTRLRIGVKKSDDGSLLAHAWLEGEHGVILGGKSTDLERFVALPDLESAGR